MQLLPCLDSLHLNFKVYFTFGPNKSWTYFVKLSIDLRKNASIKIARPTYSQSTRYTLFTICMKLADFEKITVLITVPIKCAPSESLSKHMRSLCHLADAFSITHCMSEDALRCSSFHTHSQRGHDQFLLKNPSIY